MSDKVYLNGKIITMDPKYRNPDAVLIRDDRIAVVGAVGRVLDAARADAVWYDLEGKALLPGFNDNHFHAVGAGLRSGNADLSGLDNDGIIASLKERRKTHPEDDIIRSYGWDYPSCPKPHRKILDEHFPDIPVFLTQFSGHALWTNTAGLKLMRLLDNKKPGGEIVLVDEDGSPTGIVREAGRNRYLRRQYRKRGSSPEKIRYGLKTILADLARAGVTSVQDNTWFKKPIQVLKELKESGELTCRFSCWSRNEARFTESWISSEDFDDDWFHRGPCKYIFDGAFSSHSGWLFEDYADEPGNSGAGRSADEIYKYLERDIRRKRQVACHTIGDRAVYELCLAVERLAARYPWTTDLRIRIEHGQLMRPEEIKKIADLGIVVSAQPPALINPEKDRGLLGAERAAAAYPYRSLLDAGVVVSFGSDYPGEKFFDPIRSIHLAANRDGAERITAEEAVACFTRGSAYVEVQEESKGSVTPGKLADFVILSDDPCSIPPGEIEKLEVIQTIVGGKTVYKAQELTEIRPSKDGAAAT